ncbi:hypothetical protein L1987_70616 [Smallanthus sonchifolius]|uniref:Uncharacterized protein n=1 Tax=Smallanthus sonchifolius TaxID=185202 RepID=A0ACB9API8_9ASTR|nr:hypothetical protein L1987_70616 [Smallanthus sonchifolius]
MESSAIERYIPQKSKKRVFSGSSSEPEVIEIAPPVVDRTFERKEKGIKKEVGSHEIIDVDTMKTART